MTDNNDTILFYIDMKMQGYLDKQIVKKKFINEHYTKWKLIHESIKKSYFKHCEEKWNRI